jgi:hypothetical protein
MNICNKLFEINSLNHKIKLEYYKFIINNLWHILYLNQKNLAFLPYS